MNSTAKVLYIEHKAEHWLLAICLSALCVLAVAYVYFLSLSVVHVVVSRETERSLDTLQSEIAALEANYMERQHAISMEIVESQGYTAASEKIFLSRGDASLVTKR